MNLILVRHGETQLNKNGLIQGIHDAPLNDTGRKQAKAVAHAIKKETVSALYTSPLARAVETAGMIADPSNLSPMHIDDLKEADTGVLHGLTGAEMRERYPEFMKLWHEDAGTAQMPGGECLLQVQNRAWDAVTRLSKQHTEDTIVVVSHNFTILTIVCKVLDIPLNNFRRLKQGLCAITRIELKDERHVLLSLNETAHLREICNA